MYRILIFIIFFLFQISLLFGAYDPVLRQGEMRINFIPELILIGNTPVPGWKVYNDDLDKIFEKDSSTERKFRFTNGEYMFFDWWFMPINRLKINVGYEMTMDYADTYCQPINVEHQIHNDYFSSLTEEEKEGGIDLTKIEKRFKFWKGKIDYRNNFLHTRLFKGYGHAGWDYNGDIFGFYPEQWDVDNYRRVGRDAAPTALEVDWNMRFGGRNYGNLSAAIGPEPVWGNGWSYYAKYTYKYRFWIPTLLFKSETVKWGETADEKIWALALTSKYYGVRNIPLEFGILFKPFRVNRDYTVTHSVDKSYGYGESGYFIETKRTTYFDTFGIKVKGDTTIIPFIDKTSLSCEYLGKIAGNKYEINLGLEKKVNNIYSFYMGNKFTAPVEGPEVLILEGDENHPGQPITEPRDRYDAFWVNSGNRTAYISSLTIVFDPTPGSWIFQYRPYILEEWNLNRYETSPYAFLFNYKMSYYPGTTDLEPYISSTGEYLWPGEYDTKAHRMPAVNLSGAWKLKRPIHFFTMINEFKVFNNGLLLAIIKTGEQIASSSIPYTSSTYELIPLTKMFSSKLLLFKYPFEVSVEYGHNVLGPEYWYQILGGVIDNMYKFSFKYNLDKNNEVKFEYTGYRETDDMYIESKLGVFDEFRLSYKAKLGIRFNVIPTGNNEKEVKSDSVNEEDINSLINDEEKGKTKKNIKEKENDNKQKKKSGKKDELDEILGD